MRLLRIEIENFGKLSGFSIDLEDGVNILCEKNGWGKSTLAVFIKAMLYGLPASSKRDLDRNERKKYTPWQGGAFGGSIEFETEKGRFRAERFFGAKEAADEFRLFDLSSNKPSSAYSADLGIDLFGIDAEGFERSTYFSQRALNAADGTSSITTKLTGLMDDVNDIGSFDIAAKVLDKRRQFYEVKGGRGRVSDLKKERDDYAERLSEYRALLPRQNELVESEAKTKREIHEAEENLRSVRDEKQRAQLYRARLEESERMQDRIAADESRRREILQAFRGQTLPTDEEISEARALLSECREEQARLQRYSLSQEEISAIEQLRGRYQKGTPSAESLERVQSELRELSRAEAERDALNENAPSESAHFRGKGIPSQELLTQLGKTLTQAEAIDGQIQAQETALRNAPKKPPLRKIAPIPFVLGALLAIVGAVLASLRIPLLIGGGILLLTGALLWALGGNGADPSSAEAAIRAQSEQKERLLGSVRTTLNQYGIFPTSDNELRTSINELSLLAHTAQQVELRVKQHEQRLENLNSQIATSQQRIRAFFESVGFLELPSDLMGALLQIRTDCADWKRLQEKKLQNDQQFAAAAPILKEKQTRVSEFLSRLSGRGEGGSSPEERLSAIERLCLEHSSLFGSIRTLKETHARFIRENKLDEDILYPTDAELLAKEREQENRLSALREFGAQTKRQLDRLTEQTQLIPELEDSVAHLEEEWKEAEANLQLLRRTSDFLSEAKEALSTRYLSDVQAHFSDYCARIDKSGLSRAVMDTDFNVSMTEGGKSRVLESFSKGKRDLLLLCGRLALVKAMFTEGEAPFLLLDDPFVNLDEENLAAARALINSLSDEFQVLYFVCHNGRI